MYKGMVESILVIALAGLGLADAWRLSNVVRADGTFRDVIGPDRYLIVVSTGLLICGVWNLAASLRAIRHAGIREVAGKESKRNMVLLVAMVLILYTAVIPLLGYLLATALFFPVIYLIFGVRPWTKSVVVGVITTALFYVIFAYLAELPLPKGLFENIL
jgi:hypothetical protein